MKYEQLEAIRKRTEKATEGPWIKSSLTNGYVVAELDCEVVASVIEYNEDGTEYIKLGGNNHESNRTFIANAREDIPALLAEVERLNGVVGALISQLELIEEMNEYANVDAIVKGAIKYASEEIR